MMALWAAMPSYFYCGEELDLFAVARNWKAYWSSFVRPFLGRRVLEVGAGIGANTELLYGGGHLAWLCLEPDRALAARLSDRIRASGMERCELFCDVISALPPEGGYDSVLYLDVLEHIEDPTRELCSASSQIRLGGYLVVLAPAHGFLFSPFDKSIGHLRRYDKSSLAVEVPSGFTQLQLRYLDSVGLLASLANRLVLQSASPTPGQISFWDRFLVPLSTVVDRLSCFCLGKSILGIWQKVSP